MVLVPCRLQGGARCGGFRAALAHALPQAIEQDHRPGGASVVHRTSWAEVTTEAMCTSQVVSGDGSHRLDYRSLDPRA
jgi:hypothetical protein